MGRKPDIQGVGRTQATDPIRDRFGVCILVLGLGFDRFRMGEDFSQPTAWPFPFTLTGDVVPCGSVQKLLVDR